MTEEQEIDILIVHTIYKAIDRAIDEIQAGDTKRGIVSLRQCLPAGYRNTFVRERVKP